MQPNNNASTTPPPANPPATTPMNPGGDIVFKDKPKKNTGMIIGMVVFALLAAGGIGFGVWAYLDGNQKTADLNNQISNLKSELSNQEQKNQITDDDSDDNTSNDDSQFCTGKYYGETSGTLSNGLSYDYKYTYNLKDDGTFTASFGDVSSTEGKFLVNGNTISLIGKNETSSPEESAPSYSTRDYLISSDCSTIKIADGEISFDLIKQD